jgi:uncharacterized protein (TIGR02118 family)
MIAAISLMRKRDGITLTAFRRHWLDVHGPLVCQFPGLRHYAQCHVIRSDAINAAAREMRIDGFPILTFDSDADRLCAHESPAMAACNVDSRSFIGAVSRVICQRQIVVTPAADAGRIKLIALLPGAVADERAAERYAAGARGLQGIRGLVMYRVLQQGPAPNSTIPHLPVSVAGIAELCFARLADLEGAVVGTDMQIAHFVVEEHRLV